MEKVKRKSLIYKIPDLKDRHMSKLPFLGRTSFDGIDYFIRYDGTAIYISDDKECVYQNVVPGELVKINFLSGYLPKISAFECPDEHNQHYPLWLTLAWTRRRITFKLDKFKSKYEEAKKEYGDNVILIDSKLCKLYYVIKDGKYLRGYCYISKAAKQKDVCMLAYLAITQIDNLTVGWNIIYAGDTGYKYDVSVDRVYEARLDLSKSNALEYLKAWGVA